MLLVVLAFLAFSSCAFGQLHRAACNLTVLEKCHNKFIGKLGGSASWYQTTDIRYVVEKQYATGQVEGLRKVCSAFQEFKECFSSTEGTEAFRDYQACTEIPSTLLFDRDGNQRKGYTRAQIYGYIMFIAQFDYACGAGFTIFVNHDSCMSGVFTTHNDVLSACNEAFFDRYERDEENVCLYVKDAIGCFAQAFETCGKIPGWFGCEYERTGIEAIFPRCPSTCTGLVPFLFRLTCSVMDIMPFICITY